MIADGASPECTPPMRRRLQQGDGSALRPIIVALGSANSLRAAASPTVVTAPTHSRRQGEISAIACNALYPGDAPVANGRGNRHRLGRLNGIALATKSWRRWQRTPRAPHDNLPAFG